MILRVLHEGQYELEGESLRRVNELDERMFGAVMAEDEAGYRRLLDQVLEIVRRDGRPLAVDDLRPSDVILPAPDSTLAEVRTLFAQEGLIGSA